MNKLCPRIEQRLTNDECLERIKQTKRADMIAVCRACIAADHESLAVEHREKAAQLKALSKKYQLEARARQAEKKAKAKQAEADARAQAKANAQKAKDEAYERSQRLKRERQQAELAGLVLPPSRFCHTCGVPSHDWECKACQAKRHEKGWWA